VVAFAVMGSKFCAKCENKLTQFDKYKRRIVLEEKVQNWSVVCSSVDKKVLFRLKF
jgi:hypothetical protein